MKLLKKIKLYIGYFAMHFNMNVLLHSLPYGLERGAVKWRACVCVRVQIYINLATKDRYSSILYSLVDHNLQWN